MCVFAFVFMFVFVFVFCVFAVIFVFIFLFLFTFIFVFFVHKYYICMYILHDQRAQGSSARHVGCRLWGGFRRFRLVIAVKTLNPTP